MKLRRACIPILVAVLTTAPAAGDGLGAAGGLGASPVLVPAMGDPSVRQSARLRVELLASQDAVRPGETILLAVQFKFLQPGLHVYGHDTPDAFAVPTRVVPLPDRQVRFGQPSYPASRKVEIAGESLTEYDRDFAIFVPVTLEADPGAADVTVRVGTVYQLCGEATCFDSVDESAAPLALTLPLRDAGVAVTRLRAEVFASYKPASSQPATSGPDAAPTARQVASTASPGSVSVLGVPLTTSNWPVALLLAVAVGILLNFTPCVLPIIPLTVGFFVYQSQRSTGASGRWRLRLSGVAFSAGLVAVFLSLGLAMVLTAARFSDLFNHQPVVLGLGLFILVMTLGMVGVYPVQLPGFVGRLSGARSGLGGAVLMGALAAVLSTPCTGPVLGGMLLWVTTAPAVLGVAAFLGMGLGMSIPYLLLTSLPGLLDRVPRSGAWTQVVKIALGVLLFGLGLSVLSGLPEHRFRFALWAALALGVAVWASSMVIRRQDRARPAGWLWAPRLMLLAAVISGIVKFWPADASAGTFRLGQTTWTDYTPAVLDQAAANGQPVLLDFVSDNCTFCGYMKSRVWPTAQATTALEGIRPVQVNMSQPQGRELAERFHILGPPALVVLDSQGLEMHRFYPVTFHSDPEAFAAAMGPIRTQLGLK